jgi:hypothetical protein
MANLILGISFLCRTTSSDLAILAKSNTRSSTASVVSRVSLSRKNESYHYVVKKVVS